MAGVAAGSFFNISKTAVLIGALICIVLITIFYRRGSRLLNPRIALAAFLTLFLLAGILRFTTVNSRQHNLQSFAKAQENVVDPKNKHPIKVTLIGYVANEPELKGNKQVFVFYSKQLKAPPYIINTDERTLVTSTLYPKYKYGDQLKIFGNIKTPQNYNNFDYISYLAKDSIFTEIFYPDVTPTSLKLSFYESTKLKILSKIFVVKDAFENSIARSIAEPNASFIDGVLLGSRSQIPQNLKDSFARTSTSHILAVSGYNITAVAVIILWFFLLFFKRPTAFWFTLVGIFIFTILTGAQASVTRAAIMGMIALFAQKQGRLNDSRNAIVLVGAIMILLNPSILKYDIGFQLSFAATLGIIYASPILEKYFDKLPNFFQFRETFLMTASAQLFVLPLLLYYFKSFSLVSLPANLIVLPTIPFTMILGFISGTFGLIIPVVGQIIGYFVWLLSTLQLSIIKLLAKPSWAAISLNFSWYLTLALFVFIVLLLYKLKKYKS